MGRHICAAFTAEGSEVLATARRHAPRVAAHRFRSLDVAGSTSEELARVLLVMAAGLPAETIREQRGEVHSRGADWIQVVTSRAARLLGWRPRFTIGESMRAMCETVDADQSPPARHFA